MIKRVSELEMKNQIEMDNNPSLFYYLLSFNLIENGERKEE